jgi:CDP-diacylglycerol---glycerol-3-phosphate 3-phosphatidyltransferase
VTVIGFLGICAAAGLAVARLWVLASLIFIASGLVDSLDGLLARYQGKVTSFGAFLDSTLDRIEEGIVLTAVAAYFADRGDELAVAACVATVLGSLMVSYTRARAEALGVECKVGLATRPVRVVILSAGLVFGAGELISSVDLLEPSIYALTALTLFTVGQRVWHVRGELQALEAG